MKGIQNLLQLKFLVKLPLKKITIEPQTWQHELQQILQEGSRFSIIDLTFYLLVPLC
jgi:hypothetical protein